MDPQNRKRKISHEEIETSPGPIGPLSAMEMIKTLELQGCRMVTRFNIYQAFRRWKKAFLFRQNFAMPREADEPQHFGIYTPFKSVEELKERRFQKKNMMFEALNNYIRWLSPSHNLTIRTAILISETYRTDEYIKNGFLMDVFRLTREHLDPLDKKVHLLFQGIVRLRSYKKATYFDCDKSAKEISMYMDYIKEKVWPLLAKLKLRNKRLRKRVFLTYKHVAFYLLRFIRNFLEAGPSSELANALLYKLTRLIREEKRRNLPTTLLHQVVRASYPFGVKLLVQCGAEINTPDYRNNLPLHLNIFDLESYNGIASYLIRNGSEVDTVSYDGRSVHGILQERKILKNNLEKVTLKCLAARAIATYEIEVMQDEYPENMINMIKIHGGNIVKKD